MSSDSSRADFLDEIVRHPDDDAPRLVYSDWLEEQGDPRGEFIRTQCQLAETDPLEAAALDLKDRSTVLLDEHASEWRAELGIGHRHPEFHRGFVESVTTSASQFLKHAPKLLESTPLNGLRLLELGGHGASLAGLEELGQVPTLEFERINNRVPSEECLAALSSPYLTNLNELVLDYVMMPDLAAEYIDRLTGVMAENLRSLKLKKQRLASDFFPRLGAAGEFPSLQHLTVHSQVGFATDLSGLGELRVPNLRSLQLQSFPPQAAENRTLYGLLGLPLSQLEELEIRFVRDPPDAVGAFVSSGVFENLRVLKALLADYSTRQACFRENNFAAVKFWILAQGSGTRTGPM